MNKLSASLVFPAAIMLAACGRQPTESAAPATSSAPALGSPVRLAVSQVKVLIAPQGPGTLNPATKRFEIPVKITNKGSLALSSQMNLPVNVGVQVMPARDGTGAVVDFTRTSLPELKPGQTLLVNVAVPVDSRVNGHYLLIALVQEHVAWFSSLGAKVGPYATCDGSLCPGAEK